MAWVRQTLRRQSMKATGEEDNDKTGRLREAPLGRGCARMRAAISDCDLKRTERGDVAVAGKVRERPDRGGRGRRGGLPVGCPSGTVV